MKANTIIKNLNALNEEINSRLEQLRIESDKNVLKDQSKEEYLNRKREIEEEKTLLYSIQIRYRS